MRVTLLHCDDIKLVDHGLGECYNSGPLFDLDTDKANNRISRVCNVYKHDSLLEFSAATWEIEASTKVLLEMQRHRHASYACKSSRYTLDKGEVIFEPTGDAEVDFMLDTWKMSIEDMKKTGKKNDIVSLMLPQAYQYKWQVQMNFRAMKNYFNLRLARTAHFQIREVSEAMLNTLPTNIQQLVYK